MSTRIQATEENWILTKRTANITSQTTLSRTQTKARLKIICLEVFEF